MHSENGTWFATDKKLRWGGIAFAFLTIFLCLLLSSLCYAEVIDRVVAYVDDAAITLSDFREMQKAMKKALPSITDEDVLNSMINSLILLKEGRRMRLEAPSKDEIVRAYIEIRIKSPLIVKEVEIEKFYREHREEFKEKEYIAVRDEIERYLFELETNRQLKRHLEELKANASVKIQLKE
jgi:hypothetical protein